jgi:Flp pilus assembly pilin Flp
MRTLQRWVNEFMRREDGLTAIEYAGRYGGRET